MAINRFFKPVDYEYTPIPFQELVTLGKYYADERKQFEKDISDTIKKFGEFSSISDIDVANYRKESIGKFSSLLDEAAMNPNVLKDAAWRSKVLSRINDIDYNQLSRYKKSAENFDIRQKAVSELKAKGLYQEWFDDPLYRDLSKWDTLNNGVMDNLSPDEYKTMRQIGDEYASKIKPTFYKKVAPNSGQTLPFYNWMAISADDLRRQFADHAQDLLSTNAGEKHFNRFKEWAKAQNPTINDQQIMESFIDALTIEQSDRLIETPLLDSAALQMSIANMANTTKLLTQGNKGAGSGKTENPLPYIFPTAISRNQQQEIASRVQQLEKDNPDLAASIKADNDKWNQNLVNLYKDLSNDADAVKLMKDLNKALLSAGVTKEELEDIENDPALLNSYVAGVIGNLSKNDEKYKDLFDKYTSLQTSLVQDAYKHNHQTNSALITNTLLKAIPAGVDKKYTDNPWLAIFEEPSNATLNLVDNAALSTLETNLNVPEQEIIAKALFGDARTISANDLDRNASSSYQWIMNNFGAEHGVMAASAKNQTNYTRKSGVPVTELTGSFLNRNINSSPDESYSIRENTAKGLYGSVKIVSVDGFAPVFDSKTGSTNQYTYRVTVKVPLSAIDNDIANKYITWLKDDLIDYNTVMGDTGLRTETEDGVEYVHVPIFINRNLSDTTKGYMDALYRESIHASNDLKEANERKLSQANPDAQSF